MLTAGPQLCIKYPIVTVPLGSNLRRQNVPVVFTCPRPPESELPSAVGRAEAADSARALFRGHAQKAGLCPQRPRVG